MGLEDTLQQGNENDICIVCEKPVRYGTGFAHIKHNDKMVTLCCPLCMEAFRKSPSPYLIRQQARLLGKNTSN